MTPSAENAAQVARVVANELVRTTAVVLAGHAVAYGLVVGINTVAKKMQDRKAAKTVKP